jgi:N-methylhydantoinase A
VVIARARIDAGASAEVERSSDGGTQESTRPVWFPGAGFVPTRVLQRATLTAGTVLRGAAIIEQMDATTVIPPQAVTRVDEAGYLHIDLAPEAGAMELKS